MADDAAEADYGGPHPTVESTGGTRETMTVQWDGEEDGRNDEAEDYDVEQEHAHWHAVQQAAPSSGAAASGAATVEPCEGKATGKGKPPHTTQSGSYM